MKHSVADMYDDCEEELVVLVMDLEQRGWSLLA